MSTNKRAAGEAVRLYPVPGAFIIGEPAVEREVSAEEAEWLLEFSPPAYTATPPTSTEASDAADDEPQE